MFLEVIMSLISQPRFRVYKVSTRAYHNVTKFGHHRCIFVEVIRGFLFSASFSSLDVYVTFLKPYKIRLSELQSCHQNFLCLLSARNSHGSTCAPRRSVFPVQIFTFNFNPTANVTPFSPRIQEETHLFP